MARLNADTLVKTLTGAGALAVAALVIAMGAMLIGGATEALQHFGPAFLTSSEWDPVKQHFGAVPSLVGTLVTATLSLLFAVPLALGIAVFLTELAPAWLVTPASLAVELMAAIPSIIYGMWGLFVLAPLLAESVLPPLQKALDWLPFFQGAPTGIGVLPASFVLSLMVVPYIAAVARDLFGMVPSQLKEAATGVGATRWEVVRYVVLPHTKLGLIGAVILGLGRALGETMAVTFVIGNSHKLSSSLLAPGSTIASTLANEFTEATDDLHLSALLALALVLYVLSVVILGLGRLLVARTTQQNART
jgi:phosphate transport system permease protein